MYTEQLGIKLSKDSKYAEWLKECYSHSKNSKHPSAYMPALLIKNGEVILKGINNLPPGVIEKKERFEGENKHIFPNHAERDLIYNAARKGISTDNLTMIMPFSPCLQCASAIITSGIKKLIMHKQSIESRANQLGQTLKDGIEILKEANIEIVAFDGILGIEIFKQGKKWNV
jgi:dCMP deaminase